MLQDRQEAHSSLEQQASQIRHALPSKYNISNHMTTTPAVGCPGLRSLQLGAEQLSGSMADCFMPVQARREAQALRGPQASQVGLRIHFHLSMHPSRAALPAGFSSCVTAVCYIWYVSAGATPQLAMMVSLECRFTRNHWRHWIHRPHRCVINKVHAILP